MVSHTSCINSIVISSELRAAIISSDDGFVSIIDVESHSLIRMIKVGEPIKNTILVSIPYFMLYISCQNKQFCCSINGQFLEESMEKYLQRDCCVCIVAKFQQRIVIRRKK